MLPHRVLEEDRRRRGCSVRHQRRRDSSQLPPNLVRTRFPGHPAGGIHQTKRAEHRGVLLVACKEPVRGSRRQGCGPPRHARVHRDSHVPDVEARQAPAGEEDRVRVLRRVHPAVPPVLQHGQADASAVVHLALDGEPVRQPVQL